MTAYTDALTALNNLLYTGGKGRITPELLSAAIQGVTDALLAEMVSDETSIAGKLTAANNLSDLISASTARTNLGLGGLAVLSSVTASLISDATANGRSLITAANYAAMRTALGLGSLATASSVTASQISDASANGQSLITAANYAAMRTALGLGSLATASSVTASQISDASANGQSLITAANYAAMRALLSLDSVNVGSVSMFACSSAPTGWLKCNGAAVSRTTYATLYASIGTTYGVGDGSTTFNLPELRGEFLRALDDSRGIDSARALGSAQTDALQSHTHYMVSRSGTAGTDTGNGFTYSGSATAETTGSVNSGSRTATETRPRNIALLACIKY